MGQQATATYVDIKDIKIGDIFEIMNRVAELEQEIKELKEFKPSYDVPTMLTLQEAAARTNVSSSYIKSLCFKKKIRFKFTGRKYLVNLESLAYYLNGDQDQDKTDEVAM